ncbi:MAG: hypothetical protein FDZ70_06605 [Actinobacteria bacterium]|nr:MAG: hypothetical protein FDZ70_06605 [Actinomycetota bacterium]
MEYMTDWFVVGATTSAGLCLVVLTGQGRRTMTRSAFAVMSALFTLTCLGYYLRHTATAAPETAGSFSTAFAGHVLFSIGDSFLGPAVLVFCYLFALHRHPPRWLAGAASTFAAVRMVLRLIDPWTHVLTGPSGAESLFARGANTTLNVVMLGGGYVWYVLGILVIAYGAYRARSAAVTRAATIIIAGGLVPLVGSAVSDLLNAGGELAPDMGIGTVWVLNVTLAYGYFRLGLGDALPTSLAAVVDDLSQGVLVLDSTGLVAASNHVALSVLPEARDGVSSASAFPEIGPPALWPSEPREFSFERDGRVVLAQVERMDSRTPYPGGAIVLLTDVTEREMARRDLEAANEQLRRAQATKDRFIANMNHELRTPLASIIGVSDLMLRGIPTKPDAEHLEHAGMINRAGRDLLAIINDILDLSRIESGPVRVDLRPLYVDEVLREVADRLAPLAAARGLAFEVATPAADVCVRADLLRLTQVLNNLCGNAIKFTESGSVTLSARVTDGEVAIDVADTGPGIAEADVERAFERFEQIERPGHVTQGTGLGLAIARELAQLMGGRIEVASEVGRGSTFSVVMPRCTAPA